MKVIFLNDVPGVGKRYDIKTVSDGYAANFLFPKNLALMANPQSLSKVEKMKKEWSEKQKISEEKINTSLVKLENFVLKIKEKANETGHLFAGIDEKRIAELLFKEGIQFYEIINIESIAFYYIGHSTSLFVHCNKNNHNFLRNKVISVDYSLSNPLYQYDPVHLYYS